MSATGQTRRLLRLGALLGLVLSLSTATADAGVVPWLIDSLFGPVSRPCQAAYGSGYGYYRSYILSRGEQPADLRLHLGDLPVGTSDGGA